ncbi:MAG: CRISPR-associated endonuclease Cas2 [Xanthomonadales bacterium]|nr:CRISPR-associated endonuclease Cas2 [Xanthomonadales bacterium]
MGVGKPRSRRRRRVFKPIKGFGQWLQLIEFNCRLSARRHAEMIQSLDEVIKSKVDALLVIDLGPADKVKPRVVSLGERVDPVAGEPTIV